MADRQLQAPDSTPKMGGEQDRPLQVKILDAEAKREIRDALHSFGFGKVGTGVRLILLTFARSDDVQRAVRKQLGVMAPEER
jgi:hypothetical protein